MPHSSEAQPQNTEVIGLDSANSKEYEASKRKYEASVKTASDEVLVEMLGSARADQYNAFSNALAGAPSDPEVDQMITDRISMIQEELKIRKDVESLKYTAEAADAALVKGRQWDQNAAQLNTQLDAAMQSLR